MSSCSPGIRMLALPPKPSLNLGLMATASVGSVRSWPQEVMCCWLSLHPSHLCCWSPSRITAQRPSARCPKPRGTRVRDTTIVSAPPHLLGKCVALGFSGVRCHLASKDYSSLTFPWRTALSPRADSGVVWGGDGGCWWPWNRSSSRSDGSWSGACVSWPCWGLARALDNKSSARNGSTSPWGCWWQSSHTAHLPCPSLPSWNP